MIRVDNGIFSGGNVRDLAFWIVERGASAFHMNWQKNSLKSQKYLLVLRQKEKE